jgi:predicted Zn-dependent protease
MTKLLAERALAIASDVAKSDRADVAVTASRGVAENARFARNEMTTSGWSPRQGITIAIGIGKRHASASSNLVDDASLRALALRALAMAKLAPEDPERMPLLPPQKYAAAPSAYDEGVVSMSHDARGAAVRAAIEHAEKAGVDIAGFLETNAGERSLATSTGLAASHRETEASFTVTARTRDATGSGWAGRESHAFAEVEHATLPVTAIQKAVRSAKPRALPPGKYTVVLEPQAVGEMLHFLVGQMDARSADEGRSYFAKKVGEKLFADFVSLRSDPTDPLTPGATFDHEGFPRTPRTWIENGRVKELQVSRYWGAKTGKAPTGASGGWHLGGGSAQSLDVLVAGVKRGLLVTRFWYNRMLEPQTIMITGLTRDGVFLVEEGKITGSVSNFRYNESPVNVLKNVEAMTKATWRVPMYGGTWRVPALRVPDFTMASTSAAV